MRTLNRKLLRDLRRMRSQAIAIGAVVAAGVCVSVLGVCNEATLMASQRHVYDEHRFADVWVMLKRAPRAVANDLARIRGVDVVEPRLLVPAMLDMPDVAEPVSLRIVGLPARAPQLNDISIVDGAAVRASTDILVSQPFATAHRLRPGDSVTAILNNRRRTLTVVGIAFSPEFLYAVPPGTLFPNNRTFGVGWMDERAVAAAFGLDGAFNNAVFRLMPGATTEDVVRRIDRHLAPYGGFGAYPRANQPSHWVLEGELSELRTTGRILPTVFAAVAAFLLHVVISRLIAAQREQIGVLEAFGYARRQIALHYAKLVMVIAAGGVLVGIPGGILLASKLSSLYGEFFSFPVLLFRVPPMPILSAALAATTVALLGGALALRSVLRIAPAVALRPPAPEQFRPTLVDRLGWQHLLAPWLRIVMRSLERRLMRVGLAIVSVSLAAAIVVVGRYADALRYVMDVEFSRAQRQSATVSFVDPKPLAERVALARWPGVLAVEPFRAVPVIFVSARTSRRGALTGIGSEPIMARPLDTQLRPVMIPADGVVLSAKLAELLNVAPGDTLQIDIMEGRRPRYTTVVMRTFTDYLGLGAYMDLDALNRVMRDGRVMSGAYLATDPMAEAETFRTVKDTPGVASLSLTRNARRSFEDTLQKAFALSLSFLISLATVIAFGVVFNTARTMLAEQAWDLATLRVLGFTQQEVARILLSQLGLIVAVAVPVGLLAGYLLAVAVSSAYDTEFYRLPPKLRPGSYGFAALIVLTAACASAVVVWRLIGRLDFLSVLKARE
jgi:putative ABC transport system permease protein